MISYKFFQLVLFSILLLNFNFSIPLQKSRKAVEGIFIYKTEYPNDDTKEIVREELNFIPKSNQINITPLNQTETIYTKGKKFRIEGINNTLIQISINNKETYSFHDLGKKGKIATIMKKNGEKMVNTDFQDRKLIIIHPGREIINKNLTIEFIDEIKEILGYKCKKAIAKSLDGQSAIIYYTEEIITGRPLINPYHQYIIGTPLEYEIMYSDGKKSKRTIEKIELKKLDDNLFNLPTDYKIISYEEFKQMIKDSNNL